MRTLVRRHVAAAICAGGMLLACCLANAAEPQENTEWKTGAAWQRQMRAPVSVRWSGQELRAALVSLSQAQQTAFFLDRRVDPGQEVELEISDQPLAAALAALAERQQLGLSLYQGVAYFGPPEAAADLQTLAALARREVRQTPAAQRSILLAPAPLSWPELTTPRALIGKLAADAKLRIVGLERVPHDLWAAGSLPPLALVDRLTLLAIGFDLQVRVNADGSAIALVPRMKPARMVESYDVGSQPEDKVRQLQPLVPEAEFKVASGKLFVRGRAEDHDRVAAALRGEAPAETNTTTTGVAPNAASSGSQKGQAKTTPTPAGGQKVYTLNVQNQPLKPVLAALAKQMGLTLELDEAVLRAAGIDPQQRISFQVKQADFDALWDAALKPAGLTHRREGATLHIAPASK